MLRIVMLVSAAIVGFIGYVALTGHADNEPTASILLWAYAVLIVFSEFGRAVWLRTLISALLTLVLGIPTLVGVVLTGLAIVNSGPYANNIYLGLLMPFLFLGFIWTALLGTGIAVDRPWEPKGV